MKIRNTRLLLFFITTLLSISILPSTAAQRIREYDTWMGIYSGVVKMGYAHELLKPDTFEGKSVYRWNRSIVYRYKVGSEKHDLDYSTTYIMDDHFQPLLYAITDISGDCKKSYEARFLGKSISYKALIDGKTTKKTVDIPKGTDFSANCKYLTGANEFSVGQKLELTYFFLPDAHIYSVDTTVLRNEKLELIGKSYDTTVVSLNYSQPEFDWLLDGQLVRQDTTCIGIRWIAEPKEKAVNGVGTSYPDIYAVQSKWVTSAPDSVTSMVARISGLMDKQQAVSDERQTVKAISDEVFEYSIVAAVFDPSKSLSLPINQEEVNKWKDASPSIQSDDPEITALAKQIVGDETNAYRAASKLRDWVYKNIEYKDNSPTKESAVEILKAKNGVCRHKAILYTALARAAGIPTKLVQGIISMKTSFESHMWAESYVGKWVALDPTRYSDFVNATCIKFADGNMEDLWCSWNNRYIPAINLDVISYASKDQNQTEGDYYTEFVINGKDPVGFDAQKIKKVIVNTESDGTVKISVERR